MRALSFLLLLAAALACTALMVSADATPAAARAAPAAPAVATPAAPATPPATGASAASVAALQSSLSGLEGRVGQIQSGQESLVGKVQSLAQSVESGLAKLSAQAAASSDSKASASSSSHADISARLTDLEKELGAVKQLLREVVAASAAPKSAAPSDALLQEIRSNQVQILAQLANATSMWSFDHEALLEKAKHHSLSFGSKVTAFAQRSFASLKENYPHLLAKAQLLSAQGLEQAKVAAAQASLHAGDAQYMLAAQLQKAGVPKQHVHTATLSILGVAALILLLSLLLVLRAVLRVLCCCCCSRPAKKSNKQKKRQASSANVATTAGAQ